MPLLPDQLNTDRLLLRRYSVIDAGWYAEMSVRNHAHLSRYESGNSCMGIRTEEDAEKVIGGFEADAADGEAAFLGAFRHQDGAFVCQIYIGVANADLPSYHIGFFCDERHIGRGYVTEAATAAVKALFNDSGAARIGLWCDDTNAGSQRVAEKLGMKLEGHIRADKRNADGSVTGSLAYGLLREDYLERFPT